MEDTTMTTTFTPVTFTTSAEYVTWRTEWRANYAQLSIDIRSAKRARSLANQAAAKDWSNNWNSLINAIWSLQRLQRTANEALDLRAQSKARATELYAIEHAEVA